MPYKVNQLNSQLRSALQSVRSLPAADPSREMSDLEKRKLSIQLSELQGEQLNGVIDVLQAEVGSINTDDEYELDVDALPSAALWKLKAYVDGLHRDTRGRAPLSAPNKRPTQPANGDAEPAPSAGRAKSVDEEQQRQSVQRQSCEYKSFSLFLNMNREQPRSAQ